MLPAPHPHRGSLEVTPWVPRLVFLRGRAGSATGPFRPRKGIYGARKPDLERPENNLWRVLRPQASARGVLQGCEGRLGIPRGVLQGCGAGRIAPGPGA